MWIEFFNALTMSAIYGAVIQQECCRRSQLRLNLIVRNTMSVRHYVENAFIIHIFVTIHKLGRKLLAIYIKDAINWTCLLFPSISYGREKIILRCFYVGKDYLSFFMRYRLLCIHDKSKETITAFSAWSHPRRRGRQRLSMFGKDCLRITAVATQSP